MIYYYQLEILANHKWQKVKDCNNDPVQHTKPETAFADKVLLEGHGDRAQVIQVRRLSGSVFEHRTVIDSLSMVQTK